MYTIINKFYVFTFICLDGFHAAHYLQPKYGWPSGLAAQP